MGLVEILLIIIGVLAFVGSFVIPEKMSKEAKIEIPEEKINQLIEEQVKNAAFKIEEKVDVDRFLSTIEDKDKQILQMRAEGYTTQEIADRLGYKTHSAVVKRIKKLGKAYQEFSGLNFGFS